MPEARRRADSLISAEQPVAPATPAMRVPQAAPDAQGGSMGQFILPNAEVMRPEDIDEVERSVQEWLRKARVRNSNEARLAHERWPDEEGRLK